MNQDQSHAAQRRRILECAVRAEMEALTGTMKEALASTMRAVTAHVVKAAGDTVAARCSQEPALPTCAEALGYSPGMADRILLLGSGAAPQ